MKLHELRAVPGATTKPKRKGRGHATGQGTTAGRGMNGQKSRSGGGVRLGFEGGQMPLYRRLPKRGFTNSWGTEYTIVNVEDLNKFEAGTVVDQALLEEAGVVKQVKDGSRQRTKRAARTRRRTTRDENRRMDKVHLNGMIPGRILPGPMIPNLKRNMKTCRRTRWYSRAFRFPI